MSLPIIDSRSDTVTRPTSEMISSILCAPLGDDVYGDDESVHLLQSTIVKLSGKADALFVPSGTMANLIACLVHCEVRGSEMIVGDKSHVHLYEQGGSAQIGGVHARVAKNKEDGTIDMKEIEELIRSDDVHFPVTKLVCLETTQNKCGGRVLTKEYIDQVGVLVQKRGLKLHIDGARIMNACVALGIELKDYVAAADSVSICLSKGLAAPIGSLLVGSLEFIAKARRLRKCLGGGMRQAGVIAAPGYIALTKMVDRLVEDHVRAKNLARGLANIKGLSINVENVQTNIVVFALDQSILGMQWTAQEFVAIMKTHNILCSVFGPELVRFCTHYQISDEDIARILETISLVLQG